MASKYYDQIQRYAIEGYGIPQKHYTPEQVDAFAVKGMITVVEAKQIKTEMKKRYQ